MAEIARFFKFDDQPPLIRLIISFCVVIVAGTLLFWAFIAAGTLIFGTPLGKMTRILASDKGQSGTIALKYIQFSQEISMFLIPTIIVAQLLKKQNERFLRLGGSPAPLNAILVILLVIMFIPLISYTGILNSRLELPHRFSAIKQWMKSTEERATNLTELLVTSSGIITLCINIFLIAIVPAFCEELLFRGTFQPLLSETLRSSHAGIWITAIIFSSIHLQFFGFLPRLILGLVFGYLFYWTGNLWYSIIAHFINNFVSVMSVYFYGWKTLTNQVEQNGMGNPSFPLTTVILSAIILFYFWNEFRKRSAVSQSHP